MSHLKREIILRSLSVFNHATPRWEAIPLRILQHSLRHNPTPHARPTNFSIAGRHRLSLTTWNIQAQKADPITRAKLILDQILNDPQSSDVIFFQDVTRDVRSSLLEHPVLRSSYLVADAEDDREFRGAPSMMTLLSSKRFRSRSSKEEGSTKLIVDNVFRRKLGFRDHYPLFVDIATRSAPGTTYRLLNVHLDPLQIYVTRPLQIRAFGGISRLEPTHATNGSESSAVRAEDEGFIDEFKLLDAWVALQRRGGDTKDGIWGGVKMNGNEEKFDKVMMFGLRPDEVEVLQPGRTEFVGAWSDHCGLRFRLQPPNMSTNNQSPTPTVSNKLFRTDPARQTAGYMVMLNDGVDMDVFLARTGITAGSKFEPINSFAGVYDAETVSILLSHKDVECVEEDGVVDYNV